MQKHRVPSELGKKTIFKAYSESEGLYNQRQKFTGPLCKTILLVVAQYIEVSVDRISLRFYLNSNLFNLNFTNYFTKYRLFLPSWSE